MVWVVLAELATQISIIHHQPIAIKFHPWIHRCIGCFRSSSYSGRASQPGGIEDLLPHLRPSMEAAGGSTWGSRDQLMVEGWYGLTMVYSSWLTVVSSGSLMVTWWVIYMWIDQSYLFIVVDWWLIMDKNGDWWWLSWDGVVYKWWYPQVIAGKPPISLGVVGVRHFWTNPYGFVMVHSGWLMVNRRFWPWLNLVNWWWIWRLLVQLVINWWLVYIRTDSSWFCFGVSTSLSRSTRQVGFSFREHLIPCNQSL